MTVEYYSVTAKVNSSVSRGTAGGHLEVEKARGLRVFQARVITGLKAWREVSRQDFAEMIDTSYSYVAQLEKGETGAKTDTWEKIAKASGLSLGALIRSVFVCFYRKRETDSSITWVLDSISSASR